MIKFKIDGKEVTASEGSTILQVARANGIDIPTFCHHEALAPWSACRLCLVEVNEDGRTRLVTSCSFQVKSGLGRDHGKQINPCDPQNDYRAASGALPERPGGAADG